MLRSTICAFSPATVETIAPARQCFPNQLDVRRPADKDGCFVGLAISGGGLRAANFSAGCMFEMQRLGLLQKVDYVSSVSGGSLAAAYYCTHGNDAWNPETIQRELTHSFASDAIGQSLLPWNSVALLFGGFNRTELIASVLQNELFMRDGHPLTYANLRPDRPRLLINATDLQSGRRFVFCNESFDNLNSDLSKYPLASAVAASAAVPVVLHPLTLEDHSTIYKQYLHVIDGGVADDLGIQTLLDTYTAQIDAAKSQGRPDPYPNGAVFIVVDSHTQLQRAHLRRKRHRHFRKPAAGNEPDRIDPHRPRQHRQHVGFDRPLLPR